MGLEDLVSGISDFAGELLENISDAVVDIGEFSKDTVETIGDQGMEALENGDLKGAIECSDMSEENKELANEIQERFKPNFGALFGSGAKIAAGTLGTVAALATPGFQPAGLVAGAALINGVRDLTTQLESRYANALANA